MITPIDVTLTGSDSPVEGLANLITYDGHAAYEFQSTDETLHLIIKKDANGQWHRVAGTDPYFSGWVDELAEQVSALKS
jgi:precorrin-6B methylase 1